MECKNALEVGQQHQQQQQEPEQYYSDWLMQIPPGIPFNILGMLNGYCPRPIIVHIICSAVL